MNPHASIDEPPEQRARPSGGWATIHLSTAIHLQDREAAAAIHAWLAAFRLLRARQLSPGTRLRLQDGRRISQELAGVLFGKEPGEGTASRRTLHLAIAQGRIQAMSTMFACPRGTFIELLVTAPWNLMGPDDPLDPRTIRGAGSALVADAIAWSRRRGCDGRVALQAENPRTIPFYERIGFCRMQSVDLPLTLVPPGSRGWSRSILRLARGQSGSKDARSPWLVLEPSRMARRADGQKSPGRSTGAGAPRRYRACG